MNPQKLPFALLAFIGLVAVVPVWLHFAGSYTPSMPPATTWIARFSLPATAMLFVAGWMGGDVA